MATIRFQVGAGSNPGVSLSRSWSKLPGRLNHHTIFPEKRQQIAKDCLAFGEMHLILKNYYMGSRGGRNSPPPSAVIARLERR